MSQSFSFSPIGYCHSPFAHKNEAGRQAEKINSSDECYIELLPGENFEQALEGLEDCDRIWVIFVFDQSLNWKPKVHTPRGPEHKLGVFATRAPYRPNPIGMSCVSLNRIVGRRLYLGESDLLNHTPILDIKPYITYADSFPEAHYPWVDETLSKSFQISYSELAQSQIDFLKKENLDLSYPIEVRLSAEPTNPKRTRLVPSPREGHCFAHRTWRVCFVIEAVSRLLVTELVSGYTDEELLLEEDRHEDKELHRLFVHTFKE